MVEFLKSIGNWFIGRGEKWEHLEQDVKDHINAQTRKAFYIGVACGVIVTLSVIIVPRFL